MFSELLVVDSILTWQRSKPEGMHEIARGVLEPLKRDLDLILRAHLRGMCSEICLFLQV